MTPDLNSPRTTVLTGSIHSSLIKFPYCQLAFKSQQYSLHVLGTGRGLSDTYNRPAKLCCLSTDAQSFGEKLQREEKQIQRWVF